MKELKVGCCFFYAEDLWEVTEVRESVYFAKILSKIGSTTLTIDKNHACFQNTSTIKHLPQEHRHTMKLYQGFTDTYNYCTECNHKEKV